MEREDSKKELEVKKSRIIHSSATTIIGQMSSSTP